VPALQAPPRLGAACAPPDHAVLAGAVCAGAAEHEEVPEQVGVRPQLEARGGQIRLAPLERRSLVKYNVIIYNIII